MGFNAKQLSTELTNAISSIRDWVSNTFSLKTHKHEEYMTLSSAIQFPDYEVVHNLTRAQSYTFPKNGFLMIGVAGGNGTRQITVTVNGRQMVFNGDSGAYQYGWGCMQVYLPIKAGIPFSFNANTGNQSVRFAWFAEC